MHQYCGAPAKRGKEEGYVNGAAGTSVPGTTRIRYAPDLIVRATLIRMLPGCRRLSALHQNGRLLITALGWDAGQTGPIELNRNWIWIRVSGWVGDRVGGCEGRKEEDKSEVEGFHFVFFGAGFFWRNLIGSTGQSERYGEGKKIWLVDGRGFICLLGRDRGSPRTELS